MRLDEYLLKKKISSQRFAALINVSISSVNKWRAGYRTPRLGMVAKIEKATKGWVKPRDWVA